MLQVTSYHPVQLQELDAKPIEHLLVIDFEANCVDKGALECQEILEFPCVLLNQKTKQQEVIFHEYIKPEVVPKVSEFCTKLTGITQAMV